MLESSENGSFAEPCENPKVGGFCFLLSGFHLKTKVEKAVIMCILAAVFLGHSYH